MLNQISRNLAVANSEAGLCLTEANWQQVGVTTLVYYLESLLFKPGFALLNKIPEVAKYLGWSGTLILNASQLIVDSEDVFILRSPFDGSTMRLSYGDLNVIIQQIKPVAVLLPPKTLAAFSEIWGLWKDTTIPFFAAADLLKQQLHELHAVYFRRDDYRSEEAFLEDFKRWSHLPRYVIADFNQDIHQHLDNKEVWIETDKAAAAAFVGKVLNDKAEMDLKDTSFAMDFAVIDAQCQCPTCTQKLTKAYLHHLFIHTPLLCQRFLMQHNVHYEQNYWKK